MTLSSLKYTAAALSLALALAGTAEAAKDAKLSIPPQEVAVRRISGDQYRNIIRDVFGPTIQFGGHFEPALKINGLAAAGSSSIGVSPAGMEQYDAMARAIAGQVTDEAHRGQMIPCVPAKTDAADDDCARRFLGDVGQLLYRRPLARETLDAHVNAAHVAAESVKDFYRGLSLSLSAMLSSPQFLFQDAELERDPDTKGGYRIDGYSKASELSFFLWNSGPDLALLTAAAKGELETSKGLKRQVERMMASPRLEAGVRAFFIDNFAFDEFGELTKDVVLFPKFSAQATNDAQEQTLKTIVQILLKDKGDYRDLFTTRKTFLTPELASIYRVPVPDAQVTGGADGWVPYEFPASDPRAGILTHISFVALHSPAGRGSPTLRGKAVREVILCQKVPPPPGNVAFNIVQDTSNPVFKTARERLTAHRENPVCAGCHRITDPMGLALENFDGAGEFRTTENGKVIDTSGDLDGIKFTDSAGLGQAIAANKATTSCLVNRLASYAVGRKPAAEETPWVNYLQQKFIDNGYRFPDLMRDIALSDSFYARAMPKAAEAPSTTTADATNK